MQNSLSIGFIGFGLIGGSIARALKQSDQGCNITAFNYHEGTNTSLEAAKSDGIVDFIDCDLSSHIYSCDVLFLCAPVLENIKYLSLLKGNIKSSCLITDVGSVKSNICHAVKELGLTKNFIGGHPMAGSERIGYENSSAHLLENAYYILTPEESTPASLMDRMLHIIQAVHAIPVTLDAELHDDIVAAISHVPHIIASALVNVVKQHDTENNQMLTLAAGGFKDITRIASSSPTMWQNICLTNPNSILKFLDAMQTTLTSVSNSIETGNETQLYQYFDEAKNYRDSVPNGKAGMFDRSYELYLDIIDETGAIASIATLLASNGVSIKNIGIIHNREFMEGVLRIELYDASSCEKANELFLKHHYTIYQR